jgi:hypothetical protein
VKIFFKPSITFVSLLATIFLTGCASLPYQIPESVKETAILEVDSKTGALASVKLSKYEADNVCTLPKSQTLYAGGPLKIIENNTYKDGGIPVPAGEKFKMLYSAAFGNEICFRAVSFTPKVGRRYIARLQFLTKSRCIIDVSELINGDSARTETPVPDFKEELCVPEPK